MRRVVDVASRYGWPLIPFHEQHPIRSGFGEPRLGSRQRNFHFGIDLPAAGWTPVYAVAGGTAFLAPDRVAVLTREGRAAEGFSYWHVVPAVGEFSTVRTDQLLGWVNPAWGHVHFAQMLDGRWVNPLRPNALTPYANPHPPHIGTIAVEHLGAGRVTISVDASVAPPSPPPPPWQAARLAPSLVRWRLLSGGFPDSGWQTAVDFSISIPPNRLFADVYASGSRPNKPNRAGRYRFYLVRRWDTAGLPPGRYEVEVQAFVSRGRLATAFARITVGAGAAR